MDFNKLKEAVEKLTKDSATREAFKENPVKTIENVVDIDLPDEQVKAIMKAVEGKLSGADDFLDKIKEEASELLEKAEDSGVVNKVKEGLGNLFGGKKE